jgi:ABC-type amino acid transport substrate-binding protein
MCAGAWESGSEAKEVYYSTAAAHEGLGAFIRADEMRFGDDLSKLDDPVVKIVVRDQDNSDFVAQANFPKATRVPLPQLMASDSYFFDYVAGSKADVAFASPDDAMTFEKRNPGKIKALAPGHYLRVFGQTLVVDNDDPRLVRAIDVALDEAMNAGAIARILDKYRKEHPARFIKGWQAED